MARNPVRGGPARELIIDKVEYDPAEGSTLTYKLSGRSGPVKLSGNLKAYSEANPHTGTLTQDVSVDAEMFKILSALQASGKFVSVTLTTPGGEILDGNMKVHNDGGIENNNGVVSLEMAGELRPR